MRCPTLNQLPPPPAYKTGWPWTEESATLPDQMSDGRPWSKISIITPSFNQGQFLEETIRSVLLQGYPNLEYIIIDGGSSDDSLRIIGKYEPWLTYWVSEPDRGQAHAINKGFARCSGDLLGWINSDDLLLPGALNHFAMAKQQVPEAILLGDVIQFSDFSNFVCMSHQKNVTLRNMVDVWKLYGFDVLWGQQGTFVPQPLYKQVGNLDESLRYVFDRDWMCRLLQVAPVYYLDVPVACFRLHNTSKTIAETPFWYQEQMTVTQRYQAEVPGFDERLMWAELEMYAAYICLSVNYWDRAKGLSHLCRALQYDWRAFLSISSLALIIRSVTPIGLLRLIKKLFAILSRQQLVLKFVRLGRISALKLYRDGTRHVQS